MTCSPCCHSAVVDGAKCLGGNLGAARYSRQRLGARALFVEARRVGRPLGPHSAIGLPGRIRAWVLPRHARAPGCIPFAVAVLACGQAAMVFGRPIHCSFLEKW